MTDLKNYRQLQSQVIDFIRFPLIVGVLFIHNRASEIVINGQIVGINNDDLLIFNHCSTFFSNVLGRIAVPLFFFISGFLFFLNVEKFDIYSYKNKLKSRVKTLLIPYLFWNLAVFTLFMVMTVIPQLNSFLNKDIEFQHFFSYFWNNSGAMKEGYLLGGGSGSTMPLAYQFWFIRDLMVAVILTPIIYFFCRTTKIYGVILIGILWLLEYWLKIVGFSSVCIFFFTAGAYMGINKRNLLKDFGTVKNLSFFLYPLIALVDLLTKEYDFNSHIHKAGIIIGIIFCFNLVALLFEKRKITPIPFLSAASFFIFAIHDPFLMGTLRKITFMLLNPVSDFVLTGLYFVNVIFTVLIALALYYILNRLFPKFTTVITGGR